jgi:putative metallohydrolase (TIGR04338 family)
MSSSAGRITHLEGSAVRDNLRASVYAAEQQVRSALTRLQGGHSTVDFFGSQLTLQPERTFDSLEEIRTYVASVIPQWNIHRSAHHSIPQVRQRQNESLAHYEYDTKTIAIPVKTGWAMREMVCLHEIAHHISMHDFPNVAAHGPEFAARYVELVSLIMGHEVSLLLRAALDGEGVVVGELS